MSLPIDGPSYRLVVADPILPGSQSEPFSGTGGGEEVLSDPPKKAEDGEQQKLKTDGAEIDVLPGEPESTVFVTPLSTRRSPVRARPSTPPPEPLEKLTVLVTPVSPKKGAEVPESEVGAGSDDDSHMAVTVRTDEGREYTVFASEAGFAIVPENVLAARLYGHEWRGSMTIRKDNGRGDETGLWMADRLVWDLVPGSYVAEGIEDIRGETRPSGSLDGVVRRRGSVSQTERSSVRSVGGSVSKACSLGARGAAQSKQTVRVRESSALFGKTAKAQKSLSSRRDDTQSTQRLSKGGEEDETESVLKTPLHREKERDVEKEEIGGGGLGENFVKVRDCEIVRSVLNGKSRKSSKLRQTLERFVGEDKKIVVVRNVKYPLNGDQVVLKDKRTSLCEKGEDRSSNWRVGKNQSSRLENGEKVRKYCCEGGFECTNEKCWYVIENKVRNCKVFKRVEAERRVCKFCLGVASKLGISCDAEKYTVNGEEVMLVVHAGEHSHELEEQLDSDIVERVKVRAVLAGSENKQVRKIR